MVKNLMDKQEIRSFMLEKRKNMKSWEVDEKSEIVISKFLSLYKNYKSYLLYFNFNNEVKTYDLISYLIEEKKDVFVPKIKGDELIPTKVTDMQHLIKNRYNILEPIAGAGGFDFDIVVVPGVAFDKKCNRIGFGAGYYDRLLQKIIYKISIGFAYEYQIVEGIAKDDFDIPMDLVITEKNIYRRNEC